MAVTRSVTSIRVRPRTAADSSIAYMLMALLLLTFGSLYAFANFTINDSPSQKLGLYRYTHEPLRTGTLVKLCGPMKRIAAMPGAHVKFTAAGVYIENELWPRSAPEFGLPHFPFGSYVVPTDMFLALGDHPDSWDGRYYGFIPLSLIASTLKPVWTE